MEDIIISIENGQWKQAVRLVKNSNYSLIKVLQTITEEDGVDVACRFLSVCHSVGFVQLHTDYEG